MADNNTVIAPQPHSRLLNLAAELRNRIYELALADTDVLIDEYDDRRGKYHPKYFKYPGLLEACRQTRSEASPMWFNSTRIFFNKAASVRALLSTLGERSKLIRNLQDTYIFKNASSAAEYADMIGQQIRRGVRMPDALVEGAIIVQVFGDRSHRTVRQIRV